MGWINPSRALRLQGAAKQWRYGLSDIALSNNFQQFFSKAEIVESTFCFFLAHRFKTLNKEQYDLNYVVVVLVVVILQIFIKNTHCFAYVAFANISSRLWLGDNTIWRILSIKEIYHVFI